MWSSKMLATHFICHHFTIFLLEHTYTILLLFLFILGCTGGLTQEKINYVNGGLFSITMLENHKILMYIMQSKDVKT